MAKRRALNDPRDPIHGEIELRSLIYELLDAHIDTIELAVEPADEINWAAHLHYLRALHRRGHEILAGCDRPAPRNELR